MNEDVRAAFARQDRSCAALGSPFTAWLCGRLGERLTADTGIGARVLAWTGDPSSDGDSVPLRLCGALHAVALSGADADLVALYAAPVPSEAAWRTIERTLHDRPDELSAILDLPPQTNEVARSSALWPALATVATRTGLPLALFEVGASACLNLNCDRFAYDLNGRAHGSRSSGVRLAPEWRGTGFDLSDPVIISRAGCDLRPLRPDRPGRAQASDRLYVARPARAAGAPACRHRGCHAAPSNRRAGGRSRLAAPHSCEKPSRCVPHHLHDDRMAVSARGVPTGGRGGRGRRRCESPHGRPRRLRPHGGRRARAGRGG